MILQSIETAYRLAKLTSDYPTPILVQILPSYEKGPYFQQLSKDCFDIGESDDNYRIDMQVLQTIEQAKIMSELYMGVKLKNKIFINGYSSSGVFAQRFSLLHPEVIETACIGGASGSIPIPIKEFNYPIGIGDYNSLMGQSFDFDEYSKIKFRYYVGELELINKSSTRYDENGNNAPMHDMSYFDRSVPRDVGMKQRNILGRDMFKRVNKTVSILNKLGIDVNHTIIPGRTHNNRLGKGVNELGDNFIRKLYNESIEKLIDESKNIIR